MQPPTDPNITPLELRDVTALLVKHYDLHEGLYDIAFELQMGVGRFALDTEMSLPGAIFGIRGIGLVRTAEAGPSTVDAAAVNPAAAPAAKKSRSPRKTSA